MMSPSLILSWSFSFGSGSIYSMVQEFLTASTKWVAKVDIDDFTFISLFSFSQQGISIFQIQMLSQQSTRKKVQKLFPSCFFIRIMQSWDSYFTFAVVLFKVSSKIFWVSPLLSPIYSNRFLLIIIKVEAPRYMELKDPDTIKYFTIKCFDTCIDSFKHKLLTPHEQECYKSCLKNVRAMHIEMSLGRSKYEELLKQAVDRKTEV